MTFDDAAFEDLLADITEPFLTGDYARWRNRLRLPCTFVTQAGPITLASEDDVERSFAMYQMAVRSMGLAHVHHKPLHFDPCPDGTIIITYETNILRRDGSRIMPPYTASALVHPDDGTWRLSSIMNAMGHHHWTGTHPFLSGDQE